jgi:hypothetical protein
VGNLPEQLTDLKIISTEAFNTDEDGRILDGWLQPLHYHVDGDTYGQPAGLGHDADP